MNRVEAPFDDQQVENLNRYQQFGLFHGFTCGRDHDDPRHLVATPAGWVCPKEGCEYTQTWAHEGMAKFTRAEEERLRSSFAKQGFKV